MSAPARPELPPPAAAALVPRRPSAASEWTGRRSPRSTWSRPASGDAHLARAGAQGPMAVLIPATWRAYGMGGDVRDPRDAIMGAADYLRASGAPVTGTGPCTRIEFASTRRDLPLRPPDPPGRGGRAISRTGAGRSSCAPPGVATAPTGRGVRAQRFITGLVGTRTQMRHGRQMHYPLPVSVDDRAENLIALEAILEPLGSGPLRRVRLEALSAAPPRFRRDPAGRPDAGDGRLRDRRA